MILLKLIDNTFGNNFVFHWNLDFDDSSLHSFPTIIGLFYGHGKSIFLKCITLQAVSNLNFCRSIKMPD